MRRSSKEGPCQEETGWPLGKMVVVVVPVVLVAVVAALAGALAVALAVGSFCH